jgi:hypothetical protein
MAEHFLGGPLIHAVANAKGLPGLPEWMEVNDSPKSVLVENLCPFQIQAESVVHGKRPEKNPGGRIDAFRAQGAKLGNRRVIS